jgi:ketosteroid isomerase-like protein
MLKVFALIFLTCGVVVAQNSNSSTATPRPRTTTSTNKSQTPAEAPAKPAPKKTTTTATTAGETPGAEGVLAAFNSLLAGIRHANVNVVMSAYWKNPQLNLFNYNGSVTKGWTQVKRNRESSYPEIKDVKLDVRDVSVTMLGTTGAIVTCLWTQSQDYKGTPETASGRMTLVFKRIGTAWKAIHLHSSPDTPNPAVIPPSEKPSPVASPTPPVNP